MKTGKFIKDSYKKIDINKTYKVSEAIDILISNKRKNFDETVEVSFNLGIDPRHSDQMVRGSVSLPHGIGKDIKVAVFAKDKNAEIAKKQGADEVGAEDLLKKIQDGEVNFDRVISTPDMMGMVSKVAKILGPKGLMPNPKMGTVTTNVGEAVKLAKDGQIHFKAEKNGIVQAGLGKLSFGPKKLNENVNSFVETIKKSKPSGAKGTFIKKISISTTMGVGLSCDVN